MDIDYNKIVDFILPNDVNKKGLSNVLKEVLKGYCIVNVSSEKKICFLKSIETRTDFILARRKDGIMIIPLYSNSLTLGDNFEEILEMRVNADNAVVLSNIKETNDPKGICINTSSWYNESDNMYREGTIRVMFFKDNIRESLSNRESILMFIQRFDLKRNDIFHDLYWDMDTLRKSTFIEPTVNTRIQISDGYKKQAFKDFYKELQDKIKDTIKPRLF